MTHTVAKPFNTTHRRFVPGVAISPDDITGPVAFDAWVERGFIAPAPPAEPEPEPEPELAPATPETEAAAEHG